MKLWQAVALAVAFSAAAPSLTGLQIASLNVRNYLGQDRWVHEAYRFAYPKPEKEKAALRKLIHKVRPDILLLQEMGSDAYLRELQNDLQAEGLHYSYRHFSGREEGRTGLSLLAKRVPEEVIFHAAPKNADDRFLARGIQELLFRETHDRAALRVFHVHLKSRYTSDPADPDSRMQRKEEIDLLTDWAARRMAVSGDREWILLAGDFNTPFTNKLMAPLHQIAQPVPLIDPSGSGWTYYHRKTDRRERVDGFWVAIGCEAFSPVGLYPQALCPGAGSDHRMAVVRWREDTGRSKPLDKFPD